MKYCRLKFLLVVLCLAVMGPVCAAPGGLSKEYRYKLAFLYKFAQYVEVPKRVDQRNIRIAVLGENPFGAAFNLISTKKPQGLSCEPVVYSDIEAFEGADILFLSQSAPAHWLEVIHDRMKSTGKTMLIVGEAPTFLSSGGMMNFVIDHDGRIKIHLNREAIKSGGVIVDARLLSLCVITND